MFCTVGPPADLKSWSFAEVDGDGVEGFLVSDSEGRIWYCKGSSLIEQSEQSEQSNNYDVAGKTQVVTYDPAYLTPLKIVKAGLTENVSYEESVAAYPGLHDLDMPLAVERVAASIS